MEGFTITVPPWLDAEQVRSAAINGIQDEFDVSCRGRIGVSTITTQHSEAPDGRVGSERTEGESRSDHIERLIQDYAGPAFWAEVGKAFPNVKSGDFGPEESDAIGTAMENAVATWLMWNEPAPTHDQLVVASALVNQAAMGMNGITRRVEIRLVGHEGVPSAAQSPRFPDEKDVVVISTVVSREESGQATLVALVDPVGDVYASYEAQ